MEYTAKYDKSTGICTIRITGKHKRPEDSITVQNFTRKFGEDENCRLFLIDMTQTEFIGGTMDILTTGTFPTDVDHEQMFHRYALLYSNETPDTQFLEDVSVNRGYRVKMFADMDKALEWLTESEK